LDLFWISCLEFSPYCLANFAPSREIALTPMGIRDFQRIQQLLWKWLVEVFLGAKLASNDSRSAHRAFLPIRNQTSNRLSRFRDYDFFPASSQIDEPRKVRFRRVNIDLSHSGVSLLQSTVRCQTWWSKVGTDTVFYGFLARPLQDLEHKKVVYSLSLRATLTLRILNSHFIILKHAIYTTRSRRAADSGRKELSYRHVDGASPGQEDLSAPAPLSQGELFRPRSKALIL
jgi:hypothetical protein